MPMRVYADCDRALEVMRAPNSAHRTRDRGRETAATCFRIPARPKRYRIEPFANVRDRLMATSAGVVKWNSLLPEGTCTLART